MGPLYQSISPPLLQTLSPLLRSRRPLFQTLLASTLPLYCQSPLGSRLCFSITTTGRIHRHVWMPFVENPYLPVILLKTHPKLGPKGKVIYVKRGYYRNILHPQGLAISATWEYFDNYATESDGNSVSKTPELKKDSKLQAFEWLNGLKLKFVRKTESAHSDTLLTPITIWEVLQKLSDQEQVDLLPQHIETQDQQPLSTLSSIGNFPVQIKLLLSEQMCTFPLHIKIISQEAEKKRLQSLQAAKKRETLKTIYHLGPESLNTQ